MTTPQLTAQLRAAALHDTVGRDDRVAYEVATGRPWRPELPDLLVCNDHNPPCRILENVERIAVEAITGAIPAPALNACRARALLKRWAIGVDAEQADGAETLEEDPLDLRCDECGAEPGEECRTWCIGRPEVTDP